MLKRGEVDGMICGTSGQFEKHLRHVRQIIGNRKNVHDMSTINMLVLHSGVYFIADTHITVEPTIDDLVETAVMTSEVVKQFGITPKVAMLSHSNFGSSDHPTARLMREATNHLHCEYPDLMVEGEMHADTALDPFLRDAILPSNRMEGRANILIAPTLDAANISYNMVKMLGDGLSVGPMLVGAAKPVHIVTPSLTPRGIVNMTAIAVVDAQNFAEK